MIFLKNLNHYFFFFRKKIGYIFGKINLINIFFWNITIGNNSRFLGCSYFRKFKNSKIIIGDNFTCVSNVGHNIIYRSCSIGTYAEDAVLQIGNKVGVSGCIIACFKSISIGNNVRIGGNCVILDGDFHTDDYRSGKCKEIVIDDNVWLGMDSKILKGVHIGQNSVIGAGSIVTKDIPANVIAAGNPCKVIKNI